VRKVTQGTRGRGDNKRGKRSAQTEGGDKQVGELPVLLTFTYYKKITLQGGGGGVLKVKVKRKLFYLAINF
jgi:hypothetical protein